MQIFVQKMCGRKLTIEIESDDTIGRLKELVYEAEESGVPPELQHLRFGDTPLLGGRTIADYDIRKEAELHLREVGLPLEAEREKAATDAEVEHVNAVRDGMRGRWRQLGISERKLKEAKSELEQAHTVKSGAVKPKNKLKLNVGGGTITTLRETLCAEEDSRLAELFSGR